MASHPVKDIFAGAAEAGLIGIPRTVLGFLRLQFEYARENLSCDAMTDEPELLEWTRQQNLAQDQLQDGQAHIRTDTRRSWDGLVSLRIGLSAD